MACERKVAWSALAIYIVAGTDPSMRVVCRTVFPRVAEVVLLATRWARALLDRVDALVARAVECVKPP
jgi:hypothetical protein